MDIVYDQRKIMATYIKQIENKINFPFKLIYVINQEKKVVFVCFPMILKILEDLLRPHTLKSNWALRRFLASVGTTSRKSWRRPQSTEENPPR